MKIINVFETNEILNPHSISVRALLANNSVQFEHLQLEAGQKQKKHIAHTNVYLYILEGSGILTADEESIPLSADMLIKIPSETPHYLNNNSHSLLRLLNIKAPRPLIASQVIEESED